MNASRALVGPLHVLDGRDADERLPIELRALLRRARRQREHARRVELGTGVERDASVAQADAVAEVTQARRTMPRAFLAPRGAAPTGRT